MEPTGLDRDVSADTRTGKHSTKVEEDVLSCDCTENDSGKVNSDSVFNDVSRKEDDQQNGQLFSIAGVNEDEKLGEDLLFEVEADCDS